MHVVEIDFLFWFSSDFAYYYPICYKLAIFEKMIMIIAATYCVLLYFAFLKKAKNGTLQFFEAEKLKFCTFILL